MASKTRVFMAGSTGEVGKRVLQNLLEQNEIAEIHLFLRTSLSLANPKVQQHIIDFQNMDMHSIPNPNNLKTIALCTLGTTIKKAGSQPAFKAVDYNAVLNFANFCIKNNSRMFAVLSSVDANKNHHNFYLNVKGEMEEAIKSLPFATTWILRPSLLVGKRVEFRLGETLANLASKFISPLLIGRYGKYRPIEMDAVAKAMSHLLQKKTLGVRTLESNEIELLAHKGSKQGLK